MYYIYMYIIYYIYIYVYYIYYIYVYYVYYIIYIAIYIYCFCSQVLHHVVLAFFRLHRSRTLQEGGITAARQYLSKCSTAHSRVECKH